LKRRWKILLGAGGFVLALALVPIVTIETTCRAPIEGLETTGYKPVITDPAWQRDETRTWLTYPQWHIVYSAASFARFVQHNPPSGYHYLRDVRGFWSSYCAMNQASAGRPRGNAKVKLYTSGLGFSAKLLVRALYENSLGRIAEWQSGANSPDDRYDASVQQRFAAFLRERPWYAFPFGEAFRGLCRTSEPHFTFRHWERRLALGAGYGVNAGFAKLIGSVSGASPGKDQQTLRFVVSGSPRAIAAVDPRFHVIGPAGKGLTLVEAPADDQFTELMTKLEKTPLEPAEISGNDDVFVTLLLPPGGAVPGPGAHLLTMDVDDPPGWRRIGLSTKAPDLLEVMRLAGQYGGLVEHVYEY